MQHTLSMESCHPKRVREGGCEIRWTFPTWKGATFEFFETSDPFFLKYATTSSGAAL